MSLSKDFSQSTWGHGGTKSLKVNERAQKMTPLSSAHHAEQIFEGEIKKEKKRKRKTVTLYFRKLSLFKRSF